MELQYNIDILLLNSSKVYQYGLLTSQQLLLALMPAVSFQLHILL